MYAPINLDQFLKIQQILPFSANSAILCVSLENSLIYCDQTALAMNLKFSGKFFGYPKLSEKNLEAI